MSEGRLQTAPAPLTPEGKLSEGKTAQTLTKDDLIQAVTQAGAPEAVLAAFDPLRLASAQLDKNYSRILEQYPRHWIALGPGRHDSQRASPRGLSEEEQEQTLKRLFELTKESSHKRTGCLVQYIDPEEGMLILCPRDTSTIPPARISGHTW